MGLAGAGLGRPRHHHVCRRAGRHRGRRRRGADRDGVRRRLPRRGDCAPRRRAVRLARPCGGGDGHRGGADRVGHGRRRRQGRLGARHGVRRRHDHLQRPGRALPARRRRAPPRAGVPDPGRERRARRARRAHDADADPAEPHDHDAGPGLQHLAARLRGRGVAGALRFVRLHPDRPAPGLLPAGRAAARRRMRRRPPMRPRWSASAC